MEGATGDVTIKVSLSCTGLGVEATSPLKAPGFLQRIRGVTSRSAKHEKRWIILYKSAEFHVGGNTPSPVYETIYESDVIENEIDIKPSIVAQISCRRNNDCKIRVYIYYSSSLTGGKDILLAGTSFLFQDLMSSTGIYECRSVMFSEHCPSAKAFLYKLSPIPPIFESPEFSMICPSTNMNPMEQYYAFHNAESSGSPDDPIPSVFSRELTFEPNYTSKVSYEFLRSMQHELSHSSKAWRERYLLERMRQGKFTNDIEAFANGWYELKVTIVGAYIDSAEEPTMHSSVFSSAPKARNLIHNNPVVERLSTDRRSMILDKSHSPVIQTHAHIGDNKRRSIFSPETKISFPASFSSYIEASVESRDKNFCRKLGTSNIEYCTDVPVYGSNINSFGVSKPVLDFHCGSSSWLTHDLISYDGRNSEIRGESVVSKDISVNGAQTNLMMYIPAYDEMNVRLNLFVDQGRNIFGEAGKCLIPLNECFEEDCTANWLLSNDGNIVTAYTEMWLPFQLNAHNTFTEETSVLVRVAVRKPVEKPVTTVYNCPYAMSCVDTSEISADDVYDFGKNEDFSRKKEHSEYQSCFSTTDSVMVALNPDTSKILGACYSWMRVCGLKPNDPLSLDNPTSPRSLPSDIQDNKLRRIDIPYPLDWLQSHVSQIHELNLGLEQVIDECARRIDGQINFRCSADKKNPELQSLPINSLGQLLINKSLDRDEISGELHETILVFDKMTCGSPTVHAKTPKNSGVLGIENSIKNEKEELSIHLNTLTSLSGGRSSIEYLINLKDYDDLISKALNRALSMESDFVVASHRKILCISQALSVVVNGVIMKLNLLAEGYILPSFADSWAKHGMLVFFEGLLSVQGKEIIMLEDSISAIESLRDFRIRILPITDEVSEDIASGNNHAIKIQIEKRDIFLYFTEEALRRLPTLYSTQAHAGGIVIKLVVTFFTQGVDIMQSVATAFGSSDSEDLQKYTNFESVMYLNKYAHRVQPVEHSEDVCEDVYETIHPLLRKLYSRIKLASASEKDILLFHEAEEICEILGGLQITFCKSGKDRTGMAMTLQQARFIGERFGCGCTDDLLLKNANLMRIHGTRLDVTKKNIGKKVYSFNALQSQFLPTLFRPPTQVMENMLKTKDYS